MEAQKSHARATYAQIFQKNASKFFQLEKYKLINFARVHGATKSILSQIINKY